MHYTNDCPHIVKMVCVCVCVCCLVFPNRTPTNISVPVSVARVYINKRFCSDKLGPLFRPVFKLFISATKVEDEDCTNPMIQNRQQAHFFRSVLKLVKQ